LVARAARRAGPLLVATALAAALVPSSASAHAILETTSPERGAVLKHQPDAVIFGFDEPVEGNFGAVKVYDSKGNEVDQSDAFHPNGNGPQIGVHLKPGLPNGSYTATYRVVSADGHIVSSGFVFSIGKAGAAPGQTVAQLIGKSGSGKVTEVAFGAARVLQYGAIAMAVGALVFLLIAWLPALGAVAGSGGSWLRASESFSTHLRRLLYVAVALGVVSAAGGVVLEAAEAAGISGFSALKSSIIREELGTRFGTIWGLCFAAWVAFAVMLPFALGRASQRVFALRPAELGATGVAMPGSSVGVRLLPLAIPLAFVVLEPALAGHGSTQSPVALLFSSISLHVAAMAVWLGGLVTLLVVVARATRELEPPDRSRLLAAVLVRFSQAALIAVGVILISGLIQAYVLVRHPHALLDSGYGRAVLIKFCLLMALISLGAYNRYRSVPRLEKVAAGGEAPGRAGLLLRRALRGEVALLVVVLGVTGALASYAPSIAAQTGPYSTSTTLGPTSFQMTIDPARVGANEIHLYMFDAKSGAQYTGTKELDVTASDTDKGITLPLTPQLSGPGHYTIPGALLSVPGTWKIGVTLRVSAFDEFTKDFEVPVR
jgi:copper transport protein